MKRLTLTAILLIIATLCYGDTRRKVIFPIEKRKYIVNNADNPVGSSAPVSPDAIGMAGSIRYDSGYIYICTSSNTWVRAALSTWTVERDIRSIAGNDIRAIGDTDIRTVEEH